MIARILALLARPDELTAARAELRQTHKALAEQLAINARLAELCAAADGRTADMGKKLSTEQLTTEALDAEVKRLVRQNNVINLRADAAIAEATRVRADAEYVAAERCECGGDTVEFWRLRAAAAEKQAGQDRVNAIALADEVERLRLIADEAERLHQVIELGRAGIAVVS